MADAARKASPSEGGEGAPAPCAEINCFGEEDSNERNPSGVSFVFNHRIFRTFMKVLKMLFSLSKRIFDKLKAL